MLVAKAVRKGRTQAEADEIIGWLTGYGAPQMRLQCRMEHCMERTNTMNVLDIMKRPAAYVSGYENHDRHSAGFPL